MELLKLSTSNDLCWLEPQKCACGYYYYYYYYYYCKQHLWCNQKQTGKQFLSESCYCTQCSTNLKHLNHSSNLTL